MLKQFSNLPNVEEPKVGEIFFPEEIKSRDWDEKTEKEKADLRVHDMNRKGRYYVR